MSADALRGLHVPGDPLVLPNAWDARRARLVERLAELGVARISLGHYLHAEMEGAAA